MLGRRSNPLTMVSFAIRLLMVLQLGGVLAWGSVFQSKDCGHELLSYSRPFSDSQLFYINGRAVDAAWFCQKLEFYYRSGCFWDSDGEEWRVVGDKYCNLQLSASESMEFIHPAGSNLQFRNKEREDLLYKCLCYRLGHESSRKLLPRPRINDFAIPSTQEEHHDSMSSSSKNFVVAASGMLLLCCALVCPCFRARKKATALSELSKDPHSMDSVSSIEQISTTERIPASPLRVPPSPSRFATSPHLSRVGSVHLNVNQVLKATRNFSPALKIGEGGFGTVYKAYLQDGQVVAIKRAKKEHFDSLQTEFSSEIELLAKIEHRNLVKLLGYVDKGTERIIITEYVPNGTLREHLDGQHGKILDFNQRLEISIDVAHALTYLHLYAEKPIIHRDVKSSNILLTESYRAKVADFGFARLGPMDADQTHISTKVKGTAGYLDPEYLKTYQLTPKSDVYSFGILLVEILSARRPVELKRSANERVTVRWAFQKYSEGNFQDVLDPSITEVVDEVILSKMLNLAFQCAAPTRSDRPTMKEVGEELWSIRIDYLRSVRRGKE